MRTPRRLSYVTAAFAAGSLVAAPVAQAQAPGPGGAAPSATAPAATAPEQAGQSSDLPSRVGRLARISGTVSFHTADEDHWDPATLNYPVTTGDAFWTEPQAAASIEVAASRIDMAASTEFDVDQLDDHMLTATQAQGEAFLQLTDLQSNETYTVRTPRGVVTIATAGQYEIAAGDTQTPTTVTVVYGSAQISGDNLSLSVQGGQTATITGSGGAGDGFAGSVAPTTDRDAFLTAEVAACTPAAPQGNAPTPAAAAEPAHASATVVAAAPAVVRQMPGGSDLSAYGSWQQSAQYGQVWYPQVAQDWVPYRDGHWAYVSPWGWTWIDDEAWGYAPFHYGRWIEVDNRWGWAPTYYAPGYAVPALYSPVYAPALVSFFGFGAGLAAGLAIGGGVGFGFGLGFGGFGWGHIGWCPLGWNEPYRPWFRAGGGYFNRVNQFNVANIRNVTYNNNSVHNVTINNFANAARGATVVPTTAMLNSQRAATVAQPFSRQNFAEAHPVSTTPRPTANTAGVTPHVAQRLGLADGQRSAETRAAPGPRLGAAASGGTVPLRNATAAARGGATGTRTSIAGAAGAPSPRVSDRGTATRGGLPALRTAGAVPRAGGGAPGPAFTPRVAGAADRTGAAGATGIRTAGGAATRETGRGAPGPAIASRPAGLGGGRSALPPLRLAGTPGGTAAGQARGGFDGGQSPTARGASPPRSQPERTQGPLPRVQTPRTRSYDTPRTQTPAYHVPAYQGQPRVQTPSYRAPAYQPPRAETPRYQAPAYHAPAYQAPAYRAPAYQAPAYRAPAYQAPHYAAPQQRYAAPAQRFEAPARAAPGGRRPFPP